jgi:hypothetical protein
VSSHHFNNHRRYGCLATYAYLMLHSIASDARSFKLFRDYPSDKMTKRCGFDITVAILHAVAIGINRNDAKKTNYANAPESGKEPELSGFGSQSPYGKMRSFRKTKTFKVHIKIAYGIQVKTMLELVDDCQNLDTLW